MTLSPANNLFKSVKGDMEVNFRNKTDERDSVSSIEIRIPQDNAYGSWKMTEEFRVKPDDNVAMALAILGVGRVTDDVEHQAQQRALMIEDDNYGHTSDGVLVQAIIGLRAILIAKQREEEAASKDIEDAYFLYLLAYPKGTGRVEFESTGLKDHWVSVLRKVREDPTVLGAL